MKCVRGFFILFLNIIFIVIGIAATRSDLFANEEVSENDGRYLAKELNATFQLTSAQSNTGIKELFKELGFRYLQKKYPILLNENEIKSNNKTVGEILKLDDRESKNKKEKRKQNCPQ